MKPLTAFAVNALSEPGMIRDPGCVGLYVQVTVGKDGSVNKSYIYRFKLAGRSREMGLGSVVTTSLAEVRKLAAEAREAVRNGIDPIAARKRTKAEAVAIRSRTFKDASEAYITEMASHWRWQQAAAQYRSMLERHVYKKLGARDVRDIVFADVVAVLKPVFSKTPSVGSKLRSLIERILDHAAGDGFRDPNVVNPAAVRGALKQAADKVKSKPIVHFAAPPLDVAPSIFAKIKDADGTVYRAIEWLILSASRLQETLGACWSEIDMVKGLWTVPPARMKRNRAHVVPVTEAMIQVLDRQKAVRRGDLLFPGRFGDALGSTAPQRAMRRIGIHGITNHGFRSVFRDWCGDIGDVDRAIAELQLAHAISNATEASYRRMTAIERRRKALEMYHAWLNGAAAADDVVAFPIAAQ